MHMWPLRSYVCMCVNQFHRPLPFTIGRDEELELSLSLPLPGSELAKSQFPQTFQFSLHDLTILGIQCYYRDGDGGLGRA